MAYPDLQTNPEPDGQHHFLAGMIVAATGFALINT